MVLMEDKTPEVIPGVWYVMKDDFSGWSLYKRTKEIIARHWLKEEDNSKSYYEVWGITTAGGPTVVETEKFRANVIRVATDEDAKLPPPETLA